MFKVIATDVIIAKGREGSPALRFSENGNSVRFRFGKRVYDSNAENNTRWINMGARAFGTIVERIKKMDIQEGYHVNLIGRLDEEKWVDQNSGEQRSQIVVILDDIEFASGGFSKEKSGAGEQTTQKGSEQQNKEQNFTGYEPFSTGSFFDEN